MCSWSGGQAEAEAVIAAGAEDDGPGDLGGKDDLGVDPDLARSPRIGRPWSEGADGLGSSEQRCEGDLHGLGGWETDAEAGRPDGGAGPGGGFLGLAVAVAAKVTGGRLLRGLDALAWEMQNRREGRHQRSRERLDLAERATRRTRTDSLRGRGATISSRPSSPLIFSFSRSAMRWSRVLRSSALMREGRMMAMP